MRKPGRCFVAAVLAASLAAPVLAAGAPVPVSPGAADHFAGVGSPCPTFSWSAVAGAAGYELVVYRAPEAAAEAQAAPPGGAEPVLRARIPAGAVAWTPPAEQCLELDGTYAWLVRSTGGGRPQWSESRLFRVDVDAVLGELGPVLRRAIAAELRREAAAPTGEAPAAAVAGVDEPPVTAAARPGTRGVFSDDVELWLEETGSAASDKVQLVFATPEFDGQGLSDAWAIVVEAEDSATAGTDAGKMFFSTPSFLDPLQLFTDGTAIIGDLRELTIEPRSSPPIACTSFLQEGMFYWDEDVNTLCVCDGTSWEPIDSDNMVSCS